MTIGRRLALLLAAAAGGALVAIIGLSWLLEGARSTSDSLRERARRESETSFELVGSAARVQDLSLRLARERDLDEIEALLAQNVAAARELDTVLGGSGLASGPVGAMAATHAKATARIRDATLAGEGSQAARIFIEESTPAFQALLRAIRTAHQDSQTAMDEEVVRVRSARRALQATVTGAVALLIVLVVVFGAWMVSSISHRLTDAVARIRLVASGDLRVASVAPSSDEIGQLLAALGAMVERLHAVVAEVKNAADHVAAGSSELSASAGAMSQRSSQQAAAVQEVSASMEQVSTSAQRNADDAQQTEAIAQKASVDARDGGQAVAQTVAAMNAITGKIGVVRQIAHQTHLLSLNAAIEAARAGNHGRGFAVVAGEVKKLAESSRLAAVEIGRLADQSVDVAERAGVLLATLVPDIQHTAELVLTINGSSREQNLSAAQVNRAIQQLDQVVQQNAATAEEISSTAEELSDQAETLRRSMEFFEVDGTGYAPPAARAWRR